MSDLVDDRGGGETRRLYRDFWTRHSDNATNGSMMLNRDADDFEAHDRANILESLPDFTGLDVVDVGAGIGRFTSIFAERSRSVTATDFIESFVDKNRERNFHFSNITYMVGDAVSLELEPSSVDLVFTNWLLMYLSDAEAVQFLHNAVKWLRPGGYIHLRESCSEPSAGRGGWAGKFKNPPTTLLSGRKSTSTLHTTSAAGDSANPTRYRFSSVYIQLLQAVRVADSDGRVWKLDVEWATSVPTYIEVFSNWRQVHWLARKVLAEGNSSAPSELDILARRLSVDWPQQQRQVDAVAAMDRSCWTDQIFTEALRKAGSRPIIPVGSSVLCLNPRRVFDFSLHVNTHHFAQMFNYHVWCVETDPLHYRASLTRANEAKDKRVQFAWSESIAKALERWNKKSMPDRFDGVLATELLSEIADDKCALARLADLVGRGSHLISIEPVPAISDRAPLGRMLVNMSAHFEVLSVRDVTPTAKAHIAKYFDAPQTEVPSSASSLNWALIHAVATGKLSIAARESDGA